MEGRYEEWADLNTRFHQAISVATELPLLQEMTERLLGRWDRIRRYFFNGVLSHRVQAAQREHRNILSALAEQDLPRAPERGAASQPPRARGLPAIPGQPAVAQASLVFSPSSRVVVPGPRFSVLGQEPHFCS